MKITALPREALAKWGLPKLVLISFLFSVFYFLFASTSAFAQSDNYQETTVGNPESIQNSNRAIPYGPNLEEDVPRDQHSYIQTVMIEVMAAAICQLSGSDPMRKDRKCLGADPNTGKIGFF